MKNIKEKWSKYFWILVAIVTIIAFELAPPSDLYSKSFASATIVLFWSFFLYIIIFTLLKIPQKPSIGDSQSNNTRKYSILKLFVMIIIFLVIFYFLIGWNNLPGCEWLGCTFKEH